MTADHSTRTAVRRKRLTWLGIVIGLILLAYELSTVTIDPRLLADDYVVEIMKASRQPSSPIADLLISSQPATVWLRRLLLLAMILAGLSASRTALRYSTFPWLYQKDFIQLLLVGTWRALSIPASLLHDALLLFAQPAQTPTGSQIVPLGASLIDLIPATAVVMLLSFVRSLEQKTTAFSVAGGVQIL